MNKLNLLVALSLLTFSAGADSFGDCINRCLLEKVKCLDRAQTPGEIMACERDEAACDARCK